MADWTAIKTEYVTTDITQREIAKKYGVAPSRVAEHSKQEQWVEQRERSRSRAGAIACAKVENEKASRAARLHSVADILLKRVEALAENEDVTSNPRAVRDLSMVLKDLKEIQDIKSSSDMREQKARIAKLEKEAKADEVRNEPIVVTFSAGPEEWNE